MRLLSLVLFLVSLGASNFGFAENAVYWLKVVDSINPGSKAYIVDGITRAEKDGAGLVVLELDTPGGLLSTTREIIQKILTAQVPVAVYVSPPGAHAGSAGALITFASDVAAMAPGTNVGAAHPVAGGGEKMPDTAAEKATNDTAAFAESLAKTRGRNAEFAVKSVRQSASVSAEQALKDQVVDLLAANPDELLHRLKGFSLKAPKGNIRGLPSEWGPTVHLEPTLQHRVVSFFANPELAYMILTAGGICLWIEVAHPGLIVPGVVGALCFLVSLVSFQMLPIHYGSLGLILLGLALGVAEFFLPTLGVLGAGGVVSFLLGSLFLMDTPVPEFQISKALIFPTVAVLAFFALGLAVVVARSRRKPIGSNSLVGKRAEVKSAINSKNGKVFVQGEYWNAVSQSGNEIPEGTIVEVVAQTGLQLVVR